MDGKAAVRRRRGRGVFLSQEERDRRSAAFHEAKNFVIYFFEMVELIRQSDVRAITSRRAKTNRTSHSLT
jgi:hypothetical protein